MKHDLFRSRHLALLLACGVAGALLVPDPAFAADNIFGGRSPLTRFIEFITGIFAYMLVIVGIVLTLGGLILGSDMSGFARRAPLVVVSADLMVGSLFGAQGGYEMPASAPTVTDTVIPATTGFGTLPWTDGPRLPLDVSAASLSHASPQALFSHAPAPHIPEQTQ